MAAPAAVLSILVSANTTNAVRGLVRVNQNLSATEKHAGRSTQALKTMAKAGLALGAAGVVVGAKKSIEAATDLEEQMNKTRVVFRGSEQDVLKWSKTTAGAFGISRREALAAVGTFGNLMVPMGIARNEASKMSRQFVELAADLASFNNASPVDTLEALRSALSGETEPMRRFGADVRVAALQSFALKRGIRESWTEMSSAQKTALLYRKVLHDTKDAQGDFGRTSGSLANQQRILRAQWDDMIAKLGQKLLPAALAVTRALVRFITQMENGEGAGGAFVKTLNAMGDAFNGITSAMRATHRVMGQMGDHVLGWISTLLRATQKWLGVMNKIPGVGKLIDDSLVESLGRSADRIDNFRERLRRLTREPYKVRVNVAVALGPGGKEMRPNDGWGLEGAVSGAVHRGVRSGKIDPFAFTGFGRGSANLMGAGQHLAPFAAIGARMGLSVTSGLRPGAITRSGNPSLHAVGRAIDVNAGSPAQMMAFARLMASRFGSRLSELIYTPLGFSIKNGARVAPYAQADHYDHVHVAMQRGGKVFGSGSGDKIPALLEPGEFVMNRKAAGAARPLLEALNQAIPRFASGGLVARAAHAAGFRGTNLLRAVAEARGESSWNERAVGDGGMSKGLMQIHTGWNPWARSMNLFDPFVNMRAAMRIFRSQGWGAWHANHLPHVAAARAAVGLLDKGKRAVDKAKKAPAQKKGKLNRKPYGGLGRAGILNALITAVADKFNMLTALAELTPDVADDIQVAQDAVGAWESWLRVAWLNADVAGITTTAQNLKQARELLAQLTAPPETDTTVIPNVDQTERVALLQTLLDQANLRTAVSQAQYGVLRNFPSFGQGGVVPGPLGQPQVVVAHGGETITPPGGGGVQVIVNGDIVNVPRGKRAIEVRDIRAGNRAPLPGRGGG